jgi:hypothetical protein
LLVAYVTIEVTARYAPQCREDIHCVIDGEALLPRQVATGPMNPKLSNENWQRVASILRNRVNLLVRMRATQASNVVLKRHWH